MTAKALREIPTGMQRVHRRFERWRSSHRGRLPIPEGLWACAAEVAREHGVFRTAKVLRLEYGKLKRLVESASPRRRAGAGCPPGPATFLELVPPPATGLSECLIELEGPRGKMRVQWKGSAVLVYRFSKTYPLNQEASSVAASSASNAFQRWTTGISLISAIPRSIRSFSSCLDPTRICRRKVRVILPNRVSTMFSQEPCVGVNTYLNRLGRVAKYARVSFEIWDEWLSITSRIVQSGG